MGVMTRTCLVETGIIFLREGLGANLPALVSAKKITKQNITKLYFVLINLNRILKSIIKLKVKGGKGKEGIAGSTYFVYTIEFKKVAKFDFPVYSYLIVASNTFKKTRFYIKSSRRPFYFGAIM